MVYTQLISSHIHRWEKNHIDSPLVHGTKSRSSHPQSVDGPLGLRRDPVIQGEDEDLKIERRFEEMFQLVSTSFNFSTFAVKRCHHELPVAWGKANDLDLRQPWYLSFSIRQQDICWLNSQIFLLLKGWFQKKKSMNPGVMTGMGWDSEVKRRCVSTLAARASQKRVPETASRCGSRQRVLTPGLHAIKKGLVCLSSFPFIKQRSVLGAHFWAKARDLVDQRPSHLSFSSERANVGASSFA